MVIENLVPFGNFLPGDQVIVPDGAIFDTLHWREVLEPSEEAEAPEPLPDIPTNAEDTV